MIIKNQLKVMNGWAMYDWANSVYNLVITSAIFPIYYNSVTSIKDGAVLISDKVTFMGMTFVNTALQNYALAFSFLCVCFLSPVLSSVADYKGNKKTFLKFFCYMGALSCAGLYFFKSDNLPLGIFFIITASIGFWGSLVFYNSYLPEIVTTDKIDKLSAKGFSLGYLGSSTLLIICLAIILGHESLGIETGFATRICFILVAIWWIGFAQITFSRLPKTIVAESHKQGNWTKGFSELKKVWEIVKRDSSLKTFLGSFFLYSMGVQTVMLVAVNYGDKLLMLDTSNLIGTVLIIQFVGILGAWLFSKLSKSAGNKTGIITAVIIWIGICIGGYYVGIYKSEYGFYTLAFFVGLVMGGIQSLSRATFSKLVPENTEDTTSFFSFYDVAEKLAIVIGISSYGLIEEVTGSMQNSIIALAIFFIAGFIVLIPLRDKRLAAYNDVDSEVITN
ncbi:MAG: MFS transporter [Bacteroidia bacterium]|nr:MFS transporter [Bacteroidia bacterium]